nr:immunoglobulin light chain junction region [Macaca mulatta]MOX56224.1 immunoglobulin light chain junction region [Macaca mulatta]
CMQGLEFPFIF